MHFEFVIRLWKAIAKNKWVQCLINDYLWFFIYLLFLFSRNVSLIHIMCFHTINISDKVISEKNISFCKYSSSKCSDVHCSIPHITKQMFRCALLATTYNQAVSSQLSLFIPWILYWYCILVLTRTRYVLMQKLHVYSREHNNTVLQLLILFETLPFVLTLFTLYFIFPSYFAISTTAIKDYKCICIWIRKY